MATPIRGRVEYEFTINIGYVEGIRTRRLQFIQGRMVVCNEEDIERTLALYLDEENERIDIINHLIKELECNIQEKILLSKVIFTIDKNREEAKNQQKLYLEKAKSFYKTIVRRNIMFVEEARRYYLEKLSTTKISKDEDDLWKTIRDEVVSMSPDDLYGKFIFQYKPDYHRLLLETNIMSDLKMRRRFRTQKMKETLIRLTSESGNMFAIS